MLFRVSFLQQTNVTAMANAREIKSAAWSNAVALNAQVRLQ
jgi:hypothetical protein